MLSHGFSLNSVIVGTMIPIPKDKKKSCVILTTIWSLR